MHISLTYITFLFIAKAFGGADNTCFENCAKNIDKKIKSRNLNEEAIKRKYYDIISQPIPNHYIYRHSSSAVLEYDLNYQIGCTVDRILQKLIISFFMVELRTSYSFFLNLDFQVGKVTPRQLCLAGLKNIYEICRHTRLYAFIKCMVGLKNSYSVNQLELLDLWLVYNLAKSKMCELPRDILANL